jgi:hypothetical protein
MMHPSRWILPLAVFGAVLAAKPAAADQLVIKFPGQHPDYVFEAEPHAIVAPLFHHDPIPGLGFRGTIEIVDNGFIESINNTVGITFGVDWLARGVWVPVAMQWNFWLSRNWSVFGEPGIAFRVGEGFEGRGRNRGVDWLAIWAGGRFHFTDKITLTLRVGTPTLSVGVSFLL